MLPDPKLGGQLAHPPHTLSRQRSGALCLRASLGAFISFIVCSQNKFVLTPLPEVGTITISSVCGHMCSGAIILCMFMLLRVYSINNN